MTHDYESDYLISRTEHERFLAQEFYDLFDKQQRQKKDEQNMTTISFNEKYRDLAGFEVEYVKSIKDTAEIYLDVLKDIPSSREMSLAITKLEESVMWATKAITTNRD